MKYLLPVFGICILFASCIKVDAPEKKPFSYTIYGMDGISLLQKDSDVIYASFSLTGGDASLYPVSFTISGLPRGVTASPLSDTFRLNYSEQIAFRSDGSIALGTYPITFTVTDPVKGATTYPCNIYILPCKDAASDIASAYNDTVNRAYVYINWNINGNALKISFTQPYIGDTLLVKADLTCGSDSFFIPSQVTGNYTVRGVGQFHGDHNNGWFHVIDTLTRDGIDYYYDDKYIAE